MSHIQLFAADEIGVKLCLCDVVNFRSDGPWIFVEERIVADIALTVGNIGNGGKTLPKFKDARSCENSYPYPAIVEMRHADNPGLLLLPGSLGVFWETAAYRYPAAVSLIYLLHYSPEDSAM